jgi:hypothetical protein
MKKVSYGLDLAGYSSGGSALARAEESSGDKVSITIIRNHIFAVKTKGSAQITEVNAGEITKMQSMLQRGSVVIDTCLDLQGLPYLSAPTRVWQLTCRPVDKAFTAMPPMADKIGAVVARMQRLLRSLGDGGVLGENLFETYPAASLKLLGLHYERYKGVAQFKSGQWFGVKTKSKSEAAKNDRLAHNLTELGWIASTDFFEITHDEFDAALCALTGIASNEFRLEGRDLEKEMWERLIARKMLDSTEAAELSAPVGYLLLKSIYGKVSLAAE